MGAVGVTGEPSSYDEECSAKMATAYVTDDEGYSAVVSVFSVSILRNTMTIARAALKYLPCCNITIMYIHVHGSITIKCTTNICMLGIVGEQD